MTSKLPAHERLARAKATCAALEKEIAAATEARRRALLDDDDERAAAVLDRKLARLRLAAQRARDLAAWLPAVVVAEEQEARRPSNPAKARELLADLERRYRVLQRKHKHDLSAADQMELDAFPIAAGQLRQHIELMERMQNAR